MIQNKKRIISLILMLTLLVSALVVGAVTASAVEESYSYTFTAKQYAGNGIKTLGDVDWTLEGNGGYWGYDGTKGQQFGSGSLPYKTLTLTSGDFTGVKKITINTSGASGINASFTVSVGGTPVGDSTQLTKSATSYTFDCDSLDGKVEFSFTQTSSKAIYIKSITIIYDKSTGSNTPACEHAWDNATCLLPKICSKCGETEGEALGHNYNAEGVCANNCGIPAPKATFFVNGVEYRTVYGETVTLPACDVDVSSFNKYSYTFAGWAVEAIAEGVAETTFGKAGENVKLTTDKSFYAVFTYGKAGGEVVSYKKVTSAPADWSGTYLIVYEAGNLVFNGALTTLDTANNGLSVNIESNTIKSSSVIDNAAFVIAVNGDGYSIKSAYGNQYIGNTSYANKLVSSADAIENSISFNTSDNSVIVVSAGTTLRFNNTANETGMRFRYHKSGQQAIHLYAKTTETGTVDYYTTVLEKTEHKHSYSAEVTNPTCTEGGYTTYTCDCGDTHTGNETSALGHNFGEGLIAEVPATCVSTGTKAHKYCSVCEKYFNEAEEEVTYASLEIPVDSSAHDSSLEENGVCSDCGVFYSHTFTQKAFGGNGTLSFNGVAWTLGGDGEYCGYNTKGHQFGSSDKPYQNMTLVLAGFNNVSKVVINTSGASDIEATLVVKIGETKIGEITLTSTATEYTFTATEALSGAITLEYTQTSSKAIYIKSVNVYGEQGSICDHSDVSVVDTATCTEGGVKTTTCNNCGYATSEDSVALGHSATCGHSVANSGDNYYATIQEAIAGAAAGATIKLNANITVTGSVEVTNNVIIDLNGKTLTVSGDLVTFHSTTRIIGDGKLVIDKEGLLDMTGATEYVPVWHTEGYYTFEQVKSQVKDGGEAGNETVIFRPAFIDGSHVGIFGDVDEDYVEGESTEYNGGAADNGISFVISITWGTGENAVSKQYTLSNTLIAEIYSQKKAIQLGFKNWQADVEYTVTLRIVSGGLYYETELCTMKNGNVVAKTVTE